MRPKTGRVLIAGSLVVGAKADRRKQHADCVGADMRPGPGVDVVADLEREGIGGSFAHIECLSVLEHVKRPWLMAANLERMLDPGGTIFVSAPFIWKYHAHPHDYWRFTVEGVKALFREIEWTAEAYASRRYVASGHDVRWIDPEHDWPYGAATDVCLFGHK